MVDQHEHNASGRRAIRTKKDVSVNPLKHSQPLGAALALLGIDRAMAIHHGAQGCTAFIRTLLTQHFREIVPMQTTALTEVATIIGDDSNLFEAIVNVHKKQTPELVAILTSGVSETRGDDLPGAMVRFRAAHPELAHLPVIPLSTPDFEGSIEDGFAATLTAILQTVPEAGLPVIDGQVNILASSALTGGDIETIREMVEDFGLTPIILPDLSGTLNGAVGNFYTIVENGTKVADIRKVGASMMTISIGRSMETPAKVLESNCAVPYKTFDSVTGLTNTDNFLMLLKSLSGRDVPAKYARRRVQLQDAMLDANFFVSGKSVAMAGEPDHLGMLLPYLSDELGINVTAAVAATDSPLLEELPASSVIIGDLEDFAEAAGGAHLLIGNSHVEHASTHLEKPHYAVGLPVREQLGHFSRSFSGYGGTARLTFDIANIFLAMDDAASHVPPKGTSFGGQS